MTLRRLFFPVSLGLIVWAALAVPLPFILHLPDEPTSLDGLVSVEVDGAELNGDFLLSTVRVRRGTVAGLVEALVVDDVVVHPEERIIPPGVADDDYFARQREVFALAGQTAAAVGLRAAGYDVDPNRVIGSGVEVVEVVPGAPADGLLRPDDVIVRVDGRPVRGVDDLRAAIERGEADVRRVGIRRDGEAAEVEISPGEIVTAQGSTRRGLGVHIRTFEPRVELPVAVEIDGGRVGGTSAGLMIALTVYDKAAADVDLAAGRRVGGTGTIDADGLVGTVGSIPQKVGSAHALGLDLFLVPETQMERARAALPPGSPTRLVPVATIEDAIEALADGQDTVHGPAALPAA